MITDDTYNTIPLGMYLHKIPEDALNDLHRLLPESIMQRSPELGSWITKIMMEERERRTSCYDLDAVPIEPAMPQIPLWPADVLSDALPAVFLAVCTVSSNCTEIREFLHAIRQQVVLQSSHKMRHKK